MVNNISITPFKINTALLNTITQDNYNLLLDPNLKHEYEGIKKKNKLHNGAYNSHNSKVIL